MEKKNKKMLLVVGILLLLGGISFAYFVGTSLFEGTGSKTEAITSSIKGATVNVEGGLTFNDLDILPGHQTISSIKVTAIGNNELIPYNLIWNGTNSLNTPLKFKVYKTSNEVDVSISCDKKTKVENGYQILNEECTISNLNKLGSVVSTGTIETAKNTTKVVLAEEEFITATNDGMSVYYYVILEYPNLDKEQNADMGENFEGTVIVEESDAKPDINILAVKIEGEDGTYQDSDNIPQEGYRLNEERSVCSNGAKPGWDMDNKKFYIDNLIKNGTSCYLYFDEVCKSACKAILANITPKESPESFSSPATSNEGLYVSKHATGYGDDDGDTYYFRGAVTNNYVKFANKYWRIIRINGDGTIRMIYDGDTPRENGTTFNAETSIFNTSDNNNMYAGFKYTSGEVHGTETESTILETLNTWYINNLKSYEDNIDINAGFCNDREPSTSSTTSNGQGGTGTTATYYGALIRFSPGMNSTNNLKPTFKCKNSSDLFTKTTSTKGNKSLTNSIGLITIDEVVYAGGYSLRDNQQYYLYTGQQYWTMTPFDYNSSGSNRLRMYIVHYPTGRLSLAYVNTEYGVRPVINLKAETKFTYNAAEEKGTMTNPYVVAN